MRNEAFKEDRFMFAINHAATGLIIKKMYPDVSMTAYPPRKIFGQQANMDHGRGCSTNYRDSGTRGVIQLNHIADKSGAGENAIPEKIWRSTADRDNNRPDIALPTESLHRIPQIPGSRAFKP